MAKKTNGRAPGEVKRDELASIELAGMVRDVLGKEVPRFTEADASWRLVPESVDVMVGGSDAAAILSGAPASPPRKQTVLVPGYEITQRHPNDDRLVLRVWVPASSIKGVRMPLCVVDVPDADGGMQPTLMRHTQRAELEVRAAKDAALARGGETVQ